MRQGILDLMTPSFESKIAEAGHAGHVMAEALVVSLADMVQALRQESKQEVSTKHEVSVKQKRKEKGNGYLLGGGSVD